MLGDGYRIIEEGLCGRNTIFQDPLHPHRCGLDAIDMILETHQPLSLVIIMLGTNDTKVLFNAPSQVIAEGAGMIAQRVLSFPYYRKEWVPDVLLISPIHIGPDPSLNSGSISFDQSSTEKSYQLGPLYKRKADELGLHFLDASTVSSYGCDSLHMGAEGHSDLADAIYGKVIEIIGS